MIFNHLIITVYPQRIGSVDLLLKFKKLRTLQLYDNSLENGLNIVTLSNPGPLEQRFVVNINSRLEIIV